MCKNIVNFPERPFREWAAIESILTEALWSGGHDSEAIEHACEIIKPVFMEAWNSENFVVVAGNAEDAVRRVDIHIQEIINRMLLQIAVLAIENHQLRKAVQQ